MRRNRSPDQSRRRRVGRNLQTRVGQIRQTRVGQIRLKRVGRTRSKALDRNQMTFDRIHQRLPVRIHQMMLDQSHQTRALDQSQTTIQSLPWKRRRLRNRSVDWRKIRIHLKIEAMPARHRMRYQPVKRHQNRGTMGCQSPKLDQILQSR